jgi:hypothetical protein
MPTASTPRDRPWRGTAPLLSRLDAATHARFEALCPAGDRRPRPVLRPLITWGLHHREA